MGQGMMMGGMGQGLMMGSPVMGGMGPATMQQHGSMMGFCPMMVPGAKMEMKNVDRGVTITITSDDAKAARRIQRMAEMMRLMRELESDQ